jgi:NCS1 family nucleobase:cation symporter-1
VYARAAYGTVGSNLPALMRAIVACGWFGIQAWIGGEGAQTFFAAISPAGRDPLGPGFGGHTTTEWLSFMISGPQHLDHLPRHGPVAKGRELGRAYVLIVTLVLLVWAVKAANGLGPLLSHPGSSRPPPTSCRCSGHRSPP